MDQRDEIIERQAAELNKLRDVEKHCCALRSRLEYAAEDFKTLEGALIWNAMSAVLVQMARDALAMEALELFARERDEMEDERTAAKERAVWWRGQFEAEDAYREQVERERDAAIRERDELRQNYATSLRLANEQIAGLIRERDEARRERDELRVVIGSLERTRDALTAERDNAREELRAQTAPTPPRIKWQCSGCMWGFTGNWKATCPACGKTRYWSGSVYPDANEWDGVRGSRAPSRGEP